MEETVGRLLRERGLTLAVAESCTGGRIGDWITDVPGSSEYFLLGTAVYSNAAKQRVLGVSADTLAGYGAVSTQTAEEMAQGVRRIAGADVGLSTTGIAGPGGGSAEKPVGTVCVGLAWEGGAWSRRYDLGDRGRDWIKGFTAITALDRLRRWLLREMEGKDAEPPARELAPTPASVSSPPPRAGAEEMGGEAPCQLPRFWDADDDN